MINKLTPWRLFRCLVVLGVFFDSWLFVLSSTILQASIGLDSSLVACDAGILLCLVCYLSSKVLMYFFLVEKVIDCPSLSEILAVISTDLTGIYCSW